MMKKSNQWFLAVLSVIVVVTLLGSKQFAQVSFMKKNENSKRNKVIDHISIYYPFGYSNTLDPTNVYTVGDQVVCEHIFAYHSRESIKEGFLPIFSEIQFDNEKSQVTIIPKNKIIKSDGSPFNFTNLCEAVKKSLGGTVHASYSSLLQSIECNDNKIILKLSKIPVNMKDLFSAPDFSIFDISNIPLDKEHLNPTTGAYFIKSFGNRKVELQINPHYPKELRANEIKNVTLEHYDLGSIDNFIKNASPEKMPLFYLMGQSIDGNSLNILKEKNYNIQQFPSEWLVYIGINKRVTKEDRILIASKIDEWRDELISQFALGQKAYSIAPSDRPFGLNKNAYEGAAKKPIKETLPQSIKIGVWENGHKTPLTQKLIENFKREFPKVEVVLVTLKDNFRPKDADVYISLMGMSPADPLTHLSFLSSNDTNFNQVISREEVTELAMESDFEKFTESVQAIEKRNLESRTLIPIGHFPGIVVEASNFKRDDSLAWGWGIQAWTYKIN